jgi:hypothetical protein
VLEAQESPYDQGRKAHAMASEALPIVCDPSGISPKEMELWVNEIVPRLYKAVEEIQELPNGYLWRLPNNPEILPLVAADLNMERLCCPFLTYTLEIEPNHGPFWLRMTGGEGAKEFLRLSFESANVLDEQVAQAAGFKVSSKNMDTVETVLETIETINEEFAQTHQS